MSRIITIESVMAKLTVVVDDNNESAMRVVKRLNAPNVMCTTVKEFSTIEFDDPIEEIFLSFEVGTYTLNELKLIIEKIHPTQIAIHNIQKFYERDFKKETWLSLSSGARNYVSELQNAIGVPITLIGTAIFEETMVDLR